MNQVNNEHQRTNWNIIGSPQQLRKRFALLAFLTDAEIKNLLSVVETVSLATEIDPVTILYYMSRQSEEYIATC
jgi:hypothetical protein